MNINDNQSYEVVKHNGKTEIMKGDRLRNYLIVFRDQVNIDFKEQNNIINKPTKKITKKTIAKIK